jgi:8-oxo-dGTP pyrophosphatase MutT (NUDIX family)
MARVIHEHSAGGVVLVPVGRQTFVALIEVQERRVLALPKGHLEEGEESVTTAVREVWEETGLRARPLVGLGEISYWFYSRRQRARIAKRVEFFLLEYTSGSPAKHNDEVDGVRLVPLHLAASTVSYQGEREVLQRAERYLLGDAGAAIPVAKEVRGAVSAAAQH